MANGGTPYNPDPANLANYSSYMANGGTPYNPDPAYLENYSSYTANGGTPYNPDPRGYAQHSTYTTTGRTSPYGNYTPWGAGVSNIQSGGDPQIMRRRT